MNTPKNPPLIFVDTHYSNATAPARFGNAVRRLGPLAPTVAYFAIFVALFAMVRAVLVAYYLPQLRGVDGFLQLFPVGLRIDTIVLSDLLVIPTLLLLLLPRRLGRYTHPVIAAYFTLAAVLLVFMEVATVPFLAEYHSRPNHVFYEYLAYPKEISAMLLAGYKLALLAGAVAVYVTTRVTWRAVMGLLRNGHHWNYPKRILALPIVLGALFLGARSGLGEATPNPSMAVFSNDHLANELALNSFYSLTFSIYLGYNNPVDAAAAYGQLPRDEIIERVQSQTLLPVTAFNDPERPTLHAQASAFPRDRQPNLVVIVEESLGADFVGALGGLPLTPNLDRLSEQGVFFTNLFSIGPRTARGLEAMVSGYLPLANHSSLLKSADAQSNFFTIAGLLRQRGYHTGFIYGGESHFDNMSGFFIGNGFERIVDQDDFENPVFTGAWGASDEDLFAKANEEFSAQGDQPFFYLVLSVSNHRPYEFPDGRVALYEQPKASPHNTARYADYALGEFFKRARQQAWYDNTVFVIVADHPLRPSSGDLMPVEQFRIPGLILGAGLKPQRIDTLASQIDLLPTALDLMGIDTVHPMMGRDMMRVPAGEPGRSITQFNDAYNYRRGDQVVIYQANKAPLQFTVRNHALRPAPLDEELAKDGLAHILLPGLLYRERRYTLAGVR